MGSLLLAAVAAAPVAAANLVDDPDFDLGIAGWAPFAGTVLSHGPTDELGSPGSGSIKLSKTAGGISPNIQAYRCIPVIPGRTYVAGASARFAPGQPAHEAYVALSWYVSPNCTSGLVDADPVPPYNMPLRGVWGPVQRWETAPPGVSSAFLILGAGPNGNPADFEVSFDNAYLIEDATCTSTTNVLCLNHNRFRVIVEWKTNAGVEGFGRQVKLTDDSGYFWFFNDANVELVTKLLDACPTQFDRFWFFGAGLTNVQTVIRVRDTEAGSFVERTYTNPQLTPFAPIQDTEAFATCP